MEQQTLKTILNQIAQTNKHYEELSSMSGEKFNIFQIIKLTTNEERVHSAFLAELLNRKGSHGQGSVFFELFIKQFDLPEMDYSGYDVVVEKPIGYINEERTEGGRIDIFISDHKRNCIAIENKIYAGDQLKQLVRYKNFCDKYGASNSSLLYLTLDGKDADEFSKNELQNGEDYKTISYSSDIICWLENCRKETATLPIIREGITHYINLIKHLTNQSINKAMKDEILKVIANNPDTLKAADTIANNINMAKGRIQWSFWKGLRTALEERGLKVKSPEEDDRTATSTKTYNYYHYNSRKSNYSSLWIEVDCRNDTSIHWGAEIEDNFCSGFTVEFQGKGGISNKPEYARYRNLVCDIDSGYQTDDEHWLGWKYTNPILDFWRFNTEQMYNLVNEKYLNDLVNDIADNAKKEITEMIAMMKN